MSEEEKWIIKSLKELLNKAQEYNNEKIAMNIKTANIILNIIEKQKEKEINLKKEIIEQDELIERLSRKNDRIFF